MRSAYLNVYDKDKIEEVARVLLNSKYQIYSSGSTYKYLIDKGIDATEIYAQNEHPNILIINIIMGKKKDVSIIKPEIVIADIPDDINDVYNSILLFSAARNDITTITGKKYYEKVISSLTLFQEITEDLKKELLSNFFNEIAFNMLENLYSIFPYINTKSEKISIPLRMVRKLEYGENPHQQSFIYSSLIRSSMSMEKIEEINGRLNFNHILDINKAIELINDLHCNCCFSIKHGNISDLSFNDDINIAFKQLMENKRIKENEIYVFTGEVNEKIIEILMGYNAEAIVAISYSANVYELIKVKKIKPKLIKINIGINPPEENEIFYLNGICVIQSKDIFDETQTLNTVTRKKASMDDLKLIKTAMALSKHLKTFNAVILSSTHIAAVSQSESSTAAALKLAVYKMHQKNMIKLDKNELTVATDGSLSINCFKELGNIPVKLIIQAGGNSEDDDVIKLCNEKNIAMIFTSKRHFRHF
ncbi:MAG: hypothetical protein GX445_02560 [Elusimicrobia bacterium]|jgi:phosphoribosylaminoimidazolecarboxamide formyltransferase/IMP cyclohydrolase|nr:hypothetical protein [Elusimicrobiota bacterium]